MQNKFSFRRLGLMLRRDFWSTSKISWIVGIIIFALALFMVWRTLDIAIFNYSERKDNYFDYSVLSILIFLFLPSLLGCGFITTSLVYLELGKTASKQLYLSIPASTFEKWLSKWLIAAVGFSIVYVLFYQLFMQVAYWMIEAKGFHLVTMSLFDSHIWKMVGIYILFQSIFLLGAVSMPRFSLFKTLVILLVMLLLGVMIYNSVLLWTVPELVEGNVLFTRYDNAGLNTVANSFINNKLGYIALNVWIWVLCPIVLFTSFFQLKEKQV